MSETECNCEVFSISDILTGSFTFIDAMNGEIICKQCGLVSSEYIFMEGEIYEQ